MLSKRFYLTFILLTSALICAFTSQSRAQGVNSYIIVDDQTGKILDSQDANDKVQVASLTKIASAMVVLDWVEIQNQSLNEMAVVPPDALREGGVNPVGLQPGDQVNLRDLLYASLMQSDNIAAYTLASHVGRALYQVSPPKVQSLGPVGVFVSQMNALATKLGMKKTLFLNPHGVDSTTERPPYSTAADMARLTRYAMSKSGFRFYVSQKERAITIVSAAGSRGFTCRNTNELLGTDNIDGVKTGRTRLAGDCLILSSARSPETKKVGETVYVTPRRIVVVLLGAQQRFPVGLSLIRRGWQQYDSWAAEGRPLGKRDQL